MGPNINCLLLACFAVFGVVSSNLPAIQAEVVVPGDGNKIEGTDNFEQNNWRYISNWPKSSFNLDERAREPFGYSVNGKWIESKQHGAPDVVRRIPTPMGGIPGSKGSLKLRSLHTGVPGLPTHERQQDDFLMQPKNNLVQPLSISRSPSAVVRVFLPAFDKWEQVSGVSFGWGVEVSGEGPLTTVDLENIKKKRRGLSGLVRREPIPNRISKNYLPGIFIVFNSRKDPQFQKNSATLLIRGHEEHNVVKRTIITEPGWWTLGISFTPDGRAHYFASRGVDKLTRDDFLFSAKSQGIKCQSVNSMFFNIISRNDGENWSTEWIIDDPEFFEAAKKQTKPVTLAKAETVPTGKPHSRQKQEPSAINQNQKLQFASHSQVIDQSFKKTTVPPAQPKYKPISQKALLIVRDAEDLAKRGAIYSAELKFTNALKLISHANDSQAKTKAHISNLMAGLTALKEASDFAQHGMATVSHAGLSRFVASHKTPVLKDVPLHETTINEALKLYYQFAEQQITNATAGDPAAAHALYGLARIQRMYPAQSKRRIASIARAIVFHRTALNADPAHFQAAHELGVLMAQAMQFEKAKDYLLQSIAISPQVESWQSLARVYEQLGMHRDAELAWQKHKQTLTVAKASGSRQKFSIRWTDLNEFKQAHGEMIPTFTPGQDEPNSSSQIQQVEFSRTKASRSKQPTARPPALLNIAKEHVKKLKQTRQ